MTEQFLTRVQAAEILGISMASIIRLENKGTLRVRRVNSLRSPVIMLEASQVRELAAVKASLPKSDEAVLLLGPAVRELGALGFCDEHGKVSSASIIAAANRLRSRVRELRAAETQRLLNNQALASAITDSAATAARVAAGPPLAPSAPPSGDHPSVRKTKTR